MTRIFLTVLCVLFGSAAYANRFPEFSGWWLSPGFTASRSGTDAFAGGEISFLRVGKSMLYGGAYVDAGYYPKRHATRITSGPEIGFAALGVDGGALIMVDNRKLGVGYALRPFISIPYYITVNLFYRRSEYFIDGHWKKDNEIGFQLKVPLALGAQGR
jgi:hypothetical protein